MSTDIVLLNSDAPMQLPAHLQGATTNASAGLLAIAGTGGNRIGLRNSRFRIVKNGKEEAVLNDAHLDVIVLGAIPYVSRLYYAGAYDPDKKARPTCYSQDGLAPPLDLETRQSDKCATCPQNQKGSKIIDGKKIKACSFMQRVAVMLPGDDTHTIYRVDVKSQGLFGESDTGRGLFNIRDYAKALHNRGIDASQLVTRMVFDLEASVPKLLFKANRFVTEDEFESVKDLSTSAELEKTLEFSMATLDISDEVEAEEAAEDAPAQQEAPKQEAPKQEKPKTPAKPAVEEAPAPKKQYKLSAKAEGFTLKDFTDQGWTAEGLLAEGYLEEVAPPKPKPAPPKPTPAKPASPPKPAAQAPAATTPKVTPAKPAAAESAPIQETMTDADLLSMIEDLGK